MNESINSFNEGKAKTKEGQEKMERGVLRRGDGSGSEYLSEGKILRRVLMGIRSLPSSGSQWSESLSVCFCHFALALFEELHFNSAEVRMMIQTDFLAGEFCCSMKRVMFFSISSEKQHI